jgi:hypothetical protein
MRRRTRQILVIGLLVQAGLTFGCAFDLAHVTYRPGGPNNLLHLAGVPLRSAPTGERCVR